MDAELLLIACTLGVGLAMDAFSVSLANGMNEPCMRPTKMIGIAGIFAVFQALMPLLGWICVHTVVDHFRWFEQLIPWIAFALLGFIGGKMLIESLHSDESPCERGGVGIASLIVQGVATSIDALSVGFAIAHYNLAQASLTAVIIAIVTFVICIGGVYIGKHAGTALADKAGIFGGGVLILIGAWILLKSLLGI